MEELCGQWNPTLGLVRPEYGGVRWSQLGGGGGLALYRHIPVDTGAKVEKALERVELCANVCILLYLCVCVFVCTCISVYVLLSIFEKMIMI